MVMIVILTPAVLAFLEYVLVIITKLHVHVTVFVQMIINVLVILIVVKMLDVFMIVL